MQSLFSVVLPVLSIHALCAFKNQQQENPRQGQDQQQPSNQEQNNMHNMKMKIIIMLIIRNLKIFDFTLIMLKLCLQYI